MSKIFDLRNIMRDLNIDAFICGSGDAHQSEYVAECDLRRQYISEFTGSAGTALVTLSDALLWTDGRYYFQASKELSNDWRLMKSGQTGVPEINDWLCKNMKKGEVIGVDSFLISATGAKELQRKLEALGMQLKPISNNPIDELWGTTKPTKPSSPIRIHDLIYAGISHQEKISNIQSLLSQLNAVAIVISMLDEIAWLLNIRGADVEYNPVTIAYVVVTNTITHLFVDQQKVGNEIKNHFADTIKTHSYEEVEMFLKEIATTGKVIVDPDQLNWRLYSAVGTSVLEMTSPITLPKSIKNQAELNGIRNSHIRDGEALTAFLHWLEETVKNTTTSTTGSSSAVITEFELSEKLEEFRGKDPLHVSPSFSTIAGYGPNGAIIHYKPEASTCAHLGVDSLFLLDSGGQYLDGTTDVTRTLHFGEPTERMRDCFTLVLKGHIALARAVFPEGTVGSRLDSLARLALWEQGLDYNHGTGHGVGAFLNVHEGPQSIHCRHKVNETGFQIGMTISNEPGFYDEGHFGIRIENICVTVRAATPNNFNNKTFCTFDTITLVPIQRKLIKVETLTDAELSWLNSYHDAVRNAILPGMKERFPEAVEYLLRETEVIVKT